MVAHSSAIRRTGDENRRCTAYYTPDKDGSDCLKTEDFSPLDKVTEFKYYCRGVGLVREEPPNGHLDLISYWGRPFLMLTSRRLNAGALA